MSIGSDISAGGSSANDNDAVVTKACDTCRRKKIRCNPNPEGDRCMQCVKFNTHCHFTPIAKKRKRRRPAAHEYVKELEDKVKSLEALLQASQANQHAGQGPSTPPPPPPLPDNHWPDFQMPMESDRLLIDPDLYSSPSARSSVSPVMPRDILKIGASPSLVQGYNKMPDRAVAIGLIDEALDNFFRFMPVINKADLMHQFYEYYDADPSTRDPASWACLNAAFSMAHRFRTLRSAEVTNDGSETFKYMNNALDVVAELTASQNSLPTIQALICMGVILQGTPSPHIASVLVATAMRLAQTAGLHRKTQNASLPADEVEKRRNIFWMIYILDKDVSLRMGQPFVQDDDEMDVELPQGTFSDLPTYQGGNRTYNVINSRISLAIIQGQIYKRLNSVQASRQSRSNRAAAAEELCSVLSYWRESVPIGCAHGLGAVHSDPVPIECHYLLFLHLSHAYCLVMISQHLYPSEIPIVDEGPEAQFAAAASYPFCVEESRKAIGLLQVIHPYDYVTLWSLLHPFCAVVLVVLHSVIRSPASATAANDLEIVQPFILLVECLAGEHGVGFRSNEAKRMHTSCSILSQRGRDAVIQVQEAAVGQL
ncbi:fungal-specific transcription factor domain-containing protein [Xylariaceae sp. FL0255]|nr:fungal-specific transcription factor domain-containing protein [Xylariaceae sp. FL0255]